MQAQTAARFDDILAHVTFMGAGGKDSRPVRGSLVGPDQSMGSGGLISHPRNGRAPAGVTPTNRALLELREDGGVV